MSLPRGAVAWSVIVTFSCPSHVPWDQVSASRPLVVFGCRLAVVYVSSSHAVAWSVIVTFSCPSHVPWDQVYASGPLVVFCCRVAVSVIGLFLAVPWLGL